MERAASPRRARRNRLLVGRSTAAEAAEDLPMTASRTGARGAAVVALLAATVVASGCMTKTIRTPVFEENFTEVFLRHESRGGKPIDRGFSHPATIAPVRITNMLARIEVRKEDAKDRQPAIATDLLYPMGEGISRALAKADSAQSVVVMARQRKRNMGIFTQNYLTSMIVWVSGDKLFVKLGSLETPLSTNPNDKEPEPEFDKVVGKNRVVPSEGISAEGPQVVSANWRDPIFKDTGVLHVRAGGKIVRRTVLLDSGGEGEVPPESEVGAPAPPEGLSSTALRALADLEDARRRGEVTEADYQSRRRQILAGDLQEAPVGTPAPE